MRWIEILQLRATKASALSALVEELGRSLEREGGEYAVYRHATISTDLSVHLVHETHGDTAPDRVLGERLAATLGDQGLVSHSIWVEVHPLDRRHP